MGYYDTLFRIKKEEVYMALGIFKNRKEQSMSRNCLAIPENMYDAPFEEIIACMDKDFLEDAVSFDFEKILPYRKAEEYRLFREFPKLRALFCEHLEEIMNQFENIQDFKTIIDDFPGCAYDIYRYLLTEYISCDCCSYSQLEDRIDIIDDVLIPVADLEKYHHSKLEDVREHALEILDAADNYAEMWDIIYVFEQYFDIPREYFHDYLQLEFDELVQCYDRAEDKNTDLELFHYDFEDYRMLLDFFMDREAYEFFMNQVPHLIVNNGLEFYTLLIRVLGEPIHEVVKLHDYCAEFISIP